MNEENDRFPALSRKVIELVSRIRSCLFEIDAATALRLRAECHSLLNATRKAEGESRSSLLIGICSPEERLHFVRAAQRFSRLGRIVHQAEQIVSSIPEIAGKVDAQDIESFKPIYMMAEVELRDAVLSILRDDEQLAHGVVKKDEDLDALYAEEIKRIFQSSSTALFYDFRVGTNLLFILRAIERIGDHAKTLAIPSFYLLTAQKKGCISETVC